MTKIILF